MIPRANREFPTYGFSWPLMVGLFAVLMPFAHTGNKLLNDPDTFLHIAAGRWMLLHHAIPAVDVFSYAKLGEPWIAHEWLAKIILALYYQCGGWTYLVLLACVAFAITLAYQLRFLLGHLEPIHALLFTALSGALLASCLLACPHALA